MYRKMAVIAAAATLFCSCLRNESVEFALDSDNIELDASGGTVTVNVSSSGSWTARSNMPWITTSPANGSGSAECRIIVDSALVIATPDALTRQGTVTIQNSDMERREITVVQKNYGYIIAIDDDEIDVPDYIELSSRYFDVNVNANVMFGVRFLDGEDNILSDDDVWITASEDNPKLNLTKGARPRNVTLRYQWDINTQPADRVATLEFYPVDDDGTEITPDSDYITRIDRLTVTQTSAASRPDNLRAADSTALVAISRALNVWSEWDTSVRMERWSNVTLWEEDDAGCPENGAGRVRYVRFYLFNTDDGLPYQVSWLDAAEEIVFYSNENSQRRSGIELGTYICELTQLKRLTISAYGIDDDSLPVDEINNGCFANLEYLDLSGNNFGQIPECINPDNFPSLRVLMLRNNQKGIAYNLNTMTMTEEQFADQYRGLYRENMNAENAAYGTGFPMRLLRWSNLDTLHLSVNYLQGTIPTDDDVADFVTEYWSAGDDAIRDSLSTSYSDFFNENRIPKVLPNMKQMAINLNRFHGNVSVDNHKWLYYHPKLDWWDPYTFIFTQEGSDMDGNSATFTGVPVDLDDYGDYPSYYDVYSGKELSD